MIGYWMLYAVAAGLPILLAAYVCAALLRMYCKPERGVWIVALGASLLVPVLGASVPGLGTPAPPGPAVETGVLGLPTVVELPPIVVTPSPFDVDRILVGIWIVLSSALLLRWAGSVLQLARLRPSWRSSTLDGVPVSLTADLGPAVLGVLHPRILAPTWLRSLPRKQRDLVLLHEREHVRARDPLVRCLARIACILTPWNPLVWIISARLERAVELDCDRRVLSRYPDVRAYCATLLAVSAPERPWLFSAAAFAESEVPLRRRILAFTSRPPPPSIPRVVGTVGVAAVLMVAALAIPVPSSGTLLGAAPAELSWASRAAGATASREEARVSDRPAEESDARSPVTDDPLDPPDSPDIPIPPPIPDPVLPPSTGMMDVGVGDSAGPSPAVGEAILPAPTRRPDRVEMPMFTPYSVPPRLVNSDWVVASIDEAYPPVLREAGIGATVEVDLLVDEQGEVAATRLAKSSGRAAFDKVVMKLVHGLRFVPAMNRDQPAAVWVSFPLTFEAR